MNNRTIRDLVKGENNKVYVYLASDEIGNEFMNQAETEGFVFTDGTKPTDRSYSQVMAVNHDKTINYVGANGMIAFGSGVKKIDGKNFLRIDFEKYTNGLEHYLFEKNH